MSTTPNLFAFLALLAWPLVGLWLFRTRPLTQAILWTILGGYLLLPVRAEIKFEMIPALDKNSIPSLTAILGCMFALRRPVRLTNGFGIPELLVFGLLVGPFVTSSLNNDDIITGDRILPGVGPYDAGSAVIAQFIVMIPFFIARQCLRSAADTEKIIRVLAVAGLAYSLPMLLEIRVSPQLHVWVYGFFPHSFEQQMRDGGFRPVVFLGHGLLVAFFTVIALIATTALWRTQTRFWRLPAVAAPAYLGVVLVLCKTLGALVYGLGLVPLVRWATPRVQLKIAAVLVTIAITYPALRTFDLVPTTAMLDVAQLVSTDRSESLETRFVNEDRLLERARERFWFGWGRFGRSRIYDEYGQDITLSDGRWIITMGTFGFFGFLAEFGLIALAVVRAARASRLAESPRDSIFVAALGLIVAINLVDLLPNSSIGPVTWLLAGALLGRAEALRGLAAQRARMRIPRWPAQETNAQVILPQSPGPSHPATVIRPPSD